MKALWRHRLECLIVAVAVAVAGTALADWNGLPGLTGRVAVHDQELKVEAGDSWSKQLQAPTMAEDECPVLALRARVQTPSAGGGCNYVLQVLIGGLPLTETIMRPRLINKAPFFDPPNTKYHFQWYSPEQQGWMTMFSRTYETNWGGTGRDCEFVFDLSGIVVSGEPVSVGFRYLNPSIVKALKLEHAPLMLERVTLGVMKRSEVAKLRLDLQKEQALLPARVEPKLPPDGKPGERAYEVVWSGRKESPPAQVPFDDLTGWTMAAMGDAKVSLSASIAHLLWRRQLAKFSYAGGTQETVVEIRPPRPIPIPGRFDAANLWLYGALKRGEDRPLRITALLEDQAGRDFQIDLGPVTPTYWGLQHGVLSSKSVANARFPMKFTALVIANCKVKGERHTYLESLAFYEQNRRPLAKMMRPEPPVFPTSEDGMLPTPPDGVKATFRPSGNGMEFVSEGPGGVLRFTVVPEQGCLHGVTAQWNDGPRFRPMEGGGISLDLGAGMDKPVTDEAKLVSTELKAGSLTARWRFEQGAKTVEWEATYSVRGRTLIVDVKCAGGSAAGLAVGQVSGLPNARGIEVPYLMMGPKPGPWIACAGGLFISVLPDWYNSDFSYIDTKVSPPKDDRIGLIQGTDYQALTNGRRNDLRDRILVTVSPEFAETLPNSRNPVSPNRERLAPYMYYMASSFTPNFWRTLKRYGIDHVIANDFCKMFVNDYAEGFAMRWRPHPSLSAKQVQDYREGIKSLGYLFGVYIDARDYFPLNEFWAENKVALAADGDLREGWYGNFIAKPNAMPGLVRAVGEKVKELYPADCVYLDTHTNMGPQALDYEAGVEGAGIARYYVYGNGDSILEARKWYGSTMSEGICRWVYGGVCDMDYATLVSTTSPAADLPPLVDFDLLKIHPFEHGTMMSYAPSGFLDKEALGKIYQDNGVGVAPIEYYKYVSASLAYGHMLILGYGYCPPLSRFIQYYATMQGVQREYLTDGASEICYHNGREFVPTSRALMEDSQKSGRVRVRYSRGLTVHVNYNPEKTWKVEADGRVFELPPYGWLIVKPGEILAFSALVEGSRVDYVRCPEYIYINTGQARITEGPLEVQGAVWLKREGDSWRLIPCGDLGKWESFPTPNLPPQMRDLRPAKFPGDRGCKHIVLDTKALLGKPAGEVQVTAWDQAGQAAAAIKALNADCLQIFPSNAIVDYMLR